MSGSLLLALSVLVPEPEFFAEVSGALVGRVIIEGNTDTHDRWIHDLVHMCPGEKIRARDIREARERLRTSGYFAVNPWQGHELRVDLFRNELGDRYMDVRIRIVEKPYNWVRFGVADICLRVTQGDRSGTSIAILGLCQDACDRLIRNGPR